MESLIRDIARKNLVDPDLLVSIATVESSLNPWVVRYEPVYRWTSEINHWATENKITYFTEEVLQKTSYGLCQLMGGLCRDLGHKTMLTEILIPEINLMYACKFIKKLTNRWGEEADVIASYNAGSPRKEPSGSYVNQKYVDKVYTELRKFRKLKE